MTKEKRKRCRYQVWGGGRGMTSYQCWNPAKDERRLYVRAHRVGGDLIHEVVEMLPVCGVHRNTVDRDPRPMAHAAYQWTENDGPYRAQVEEYVR